MAKKKAVEVALPPAFASAREPNARVGELKAAIEKKLNWKNQTSLMQVVRLGVFLRALDRTSEALEVLDHLTTHVTPVDMNVWFAGSYGMSVRAWLLREQGRPGEASEALQPIREKSFHVEWTAAQVLADLEKQRARYAHSLTLKKKADVLDELSMTAGTASWWAESVRHPGFAHSGTFDPAGWDALREDALGQLQPRLAATG